MFSTLKYLLVSYVEYFVGCFHILFHYVLQCCDRRDNVTRRGGQSYFKK
jgi:hypothetical protein